MAKSIPKEIKDKVLEIVDVFNKEHKTNYLMTFRGKFAYLSKMEEQAAANFFKNLLLKKMGISSNQSTNRKVPMKETKLGRLKYNGKMDNWDFAVFKYSREFYDPDEWMFPGAEELDGTIEGALRAGKEIYN